MKKLSLKDVFAEKRMNEGIKDNLVDYLTRMFSPTNVYYSSDSPETWWKDPIMEVILKVKDVAVRYSSPNYPGAYLLSLNSVLLELHRKKYIKNIEISYDNLDQDAQKEVIVKYTTAKKTMMLVLDQQSFTIQTSDKKTKTIDFINKDVNIKDEIYHTVYMMTIR